MNILIVGYGSIGNRHARLLRPLASKLGIVTAQEAMEYPLYRSVEEAFAASSWDYVVICTVTSQHAENLLQLKRLGFTGKVLVEKPLFNHVEENAAPYPFTIYVGYHLRFHKVIDTLREYIAGSKIRSVSAHVGQHLAQWRPDRNHKETYSAHRALGGGVMRDLSHELDLAQYLFGGIISCEGKAERMGDVTVDSEDSATFQLKCRDCSNVSVHMNYLDEIARREWVVETDKGAVTADLIRRAILTEDETRIVPCASDQAYLAMHQAVFAGGKDVCSFEEGLAVVKMIDAVPPLKEVA